MAAVSTVEVLARELAQHLNEQTWVDSGLGLVVGRYPEARLAFDFGIEAFRPTKSNAAPTSEKRRISLLGSAKRVGQRYEIETRDAIYEAGSATQMLIASLELIEEMAPGTLEKLSTQKKNSKRPVARDRADLYSIPRPLAYSAPLKGGYFVATNNKANEAKGVVRAAAKLAGLQWDKDLTIRRK